MIDPDPVRPAGEADLRAALAQLTAERDAVDCAFEGLEETDRARRIGHWIGTAADGETRVARLLIAFHDAIRRPLGVTPDSGAEFYDPRMAEDAEARRAGLTQRGGNNG